MEWNSPAVRSKFRRILSTTPMFTPHKMCIRDRTQLVATIADSYYTLAMLDAQMTISNRTLENWRTTVPVSYTHLLYQSHSAMLHVLWTHSDGLPQLPCGLLLHQNNP